MVKKNRIGSKKFQGSSDSMIISRMNYLAMLEKKSLCIVYTIYLRTGKKCNKMRQTISHSSVCMFTSFYLYWRREST